MGKNLRMKCRYKLQIWKSTLLQEGKKKISYGIIFDFTGGSVPLYFTKNEEKKQISNFFLLKLI